MLWVFLFCVAAAELSSSLPPPRDHPAIGYSKRASRDRVAQLGRKLETGAARLRFEDRGGYLRSLLDALQIPVESQMAVFSKTSLQAPRIEPGNPRTIFFNDSVAVAWMKGGFIEMAAQDPEQGVFFYTLEQHAAEKPRIRRGDDCLRCHQAESTLDVPGTLVRSMFTAPDGSPQLILGGSFTDHRSPLEERWGGWFVTGSWGPAHHMGNLTWDDSGQAPIQPRLDQRAYLSPYSDVAALMVFDHQMHMMNLLTRVGWETRFALYQKIPLDLAGLARELVDYLLFVDEAPLPGPLRGTSGFAEAFSARGPLRHLDLRRRLLRYPCSYMIYSEAFDALPAEAKDAIYRRMWQILSGQENQPKYDRLSLRDRQAIVKILRDTKRGLPDYFKPVVR